MVSALPQEGKSTIAMRLAETMAVMGDRVILVEADLRKPTPLKDITEREGHGLTAVLAEGRLESEIAQVTLTGQGGELRTLDVLPAGPTPPNPTELLESRRMREVLDDLTERYDMVIVDTPALTVVSDALAARGGGLDDRRRGGDRPELASVGGPARPADRTPAGPQDRDHRQHGDERARARTTTTTTARARSRRDTRRKGVLGIGGRRR